MISLGLVIFGYVFIICPLVVLSVFFRSLKYTLDDYYDDITTLIDPGKYPANRNKDKICHIFSQHWESYFKENRDLLKHLMDCSAETFDHVLKETKHEHITPAYLAVLHTYGRDIKYNPHCHLIFAEGGFTKNKKWVDIKYIDYELIRKSWQKSVLGMLRRKLTPFYPEIPALVDNMYKRYPEGFYVRAKDTIQSKHITVKYIGRYIRHPAIASSRIINFDDKSVTFYYLEHDTNKIIYKTMSIDDFIKAILGHIPDNQFKVIRYYGAYSRRTSKLFRKIMKFAESIKQLALTKFGFSSEKYAPLCDKCGIKMTCVWYSGKGPPSESKFGEKLTDWVSALGNC